ncbi:MAG: tetratricopeptide repeat protein [Coriobacteriia bacterium]|nr:tetratricopeptide repeat protein [Coriobacteriia bacterium]
MHPRLLPVLRISRYVLIGGIIVLAALVGIYLLEKDTTPRTELERAMLAAEDAVRANPESSSARIKLAAAYLESGALASAEDQALYAVRLAPEDPAAYYVLGLVKSRRGETDAAIENLKRAVEMEGQLAGFYQDASAALALVYEDAERWDDALAAMDEALDYGPENARMLLLRAGMYERREAWADALYDYVQAVRFTPELDEAREGISAITSSHQEAVEEMEQRFGVRLDGSFVDTGTAGF